MNKLRQERRDSGLCVYCGETLDREGIYCVKCNRLYNHWKKRIG